MTRDELPNAIGRALIEKNSVYDSEADVLMPIIDAYVATQLAEVETQMAEVFAVRLQAWREKLAQNFEARSFSEACSCDHCDCNKEVQSAKAELMLECAAYIRAGGAS